MYAGAMPKPRTTKNKRPTREQLDERLARPLGPAETFEAIFKIDSDSKPVDPAMRQRARDRAGD